MHSLLAVVVSHGGSTYLTGLLAALAVIPGCRVALVENDIRARHGDLPEGTLMYAGHGNIGYGAAVNLGVRRFLAATDDRPEWLLVVNSDVTIPADTRDMLGKLIAQAPEDVDVLGFAVETDDGGPGRAAAVLPTVRTSAFTAVRGERAAVARWPELTYPVGAFFAIRTRTFLRLGGFDPAFWLYYEETDLFARLLAEGGRIGWAGREWPVRHTGGATAGRSGVLQRELGRGAALYARRHATEVGRGWVAVHALQLVLLAGRKAVARRPHDAARAVRILAGLLGGLVAPNWEPAVRSRWLAAPAATRVSLGRLTPQTMRAVVPAPAGAPTPAGHSARPVPSGGPARGRIPAPRPAPQPAARAAVTSRASARQSRPAAVSGEPAGAGGAPGPPTSPDRPHHAQATSPVVREEWEGRDRGPDGVGGTMGIRGYTGEVTVGGPPDVRELPDLTITKVAVGPFDNNCYLLRCTTSGEQLLIDAANEPDTLLRLIGDDGLATVVTTHRHQDHVQALSDIVAATGATTIAHPDDAPVIPVPTSHPVTDGDEIQVGEVTLRAIHLVGHTPGSIALLYDADPTAPHLFTGDCLFPGGPGNTFGQPDAFKSLMDGLEEKVFGPLPDTTWIYPGHGKDTTLGRERPHLAEWRARGW